MRNYTKAPALFLMVCIMMCYSTMAFAAETAKPSASVKQTVEDTGAYLLKTVKSPQVGSIGGEWAILGLARSSCEVPPSWYNAYYKTLEAYVRDKDGVLHDKKYTDYSRVILTLTAIGKDPTDVGGYNLLEKLGDYNKVIWQGINGPVFALIALNSGNYEPPLCEGAKVQTTRKLLIDTIISRQLQNGGFSLTGTTADPDTTALVLQALAPYRGDDDIKRVIDKALDCLSNLQTSNGGYNSCESENSESATQVLVALTALGIDPATDSRFIKSGNSVVDNLNNFYVSGGGFKHQAQDASPNGMATEQSFYGLVAYERFLNKEHSLYNMGDVTNLTGEKSAKTIGLPNKNPDVKASSIISLNKNFDDISACGSQEAIRALAARGVLNGVSATRFEPDRTMTRAEFAAVVVRALGLTPTANGVFHDVVPTSWYAPYVGTANTYGLVQGLSEIAFSPESTITREEAAVMVSRAAKRCGMDIKMTDTETRDVLSQFTDYTTSSDWARSSLAFCYKQSMLSQKVLNIEPQEAVTRAEIANMIYTMLQKTELI